MNESNYGYTMALYGSVGTPQQARASAQRRIAAENARLVETEQQIQRVVDAIAASNAAAAEPPMFTTETVEAALAVVDAEFEAIADAEAKALFNRLTSR